MVRSADVHSEGVAHVVIVNEAFDSPLQRRQRLEQLVREYLSHPSSVRRYRLHVEGYTRSAKHPREGQIEPYHAAGAKPCRDVLVRRTDGL